MAIVHNDEQIIDGIVQNLQRRFGGAVPEHALRQAAQDCYQHMSVNARNKDFVPILAERCAQYRIEDAE